MVCGDTAQAVATSSTVSRRSAVAGSPYSVVVMDAKAASGFGIQSQLEWDEEESARSPSFQAAIDRLRQDARAPHTTLDKGCLVEYSWSELSKKASLGISKWGPYSFDYVDRYVNRCQALAKQHLQTKKLWPRIHKLVQQEYGYQLEPVALGPPAPSGALASTLAADKHGLVDFHPGGATSMREQRYQFARRLRIHGYPLAPFKFSKTLE
jgi:hypothetical protein